MRLITALVLTLTIAVQPVQAPGILQIPAPVIDQKQEHPDLDLLARLITAEAKGECLTGQVAVGSVVLNRVADPRFPDTINGVIFEPRQFQPVWQGTLPDKAGETSREAARMALEGDNPVSDALYFYHIELASCDWIRSRETVVDIGVHRFAR